MKIDIILNNILVLVSDVVVEAIINKE